MAFDARAAAGGWERELRALGSPERAQAEQRYLKSDLRFLGVQVGEIRRVMKALGGQHPSPTHDELVALVDALWSEPVFERRLVAAMQLEEHVALLGPDDLDLLERLIR